MAVRPSTEGLALLRTEYEADFRAAPYEGEAVIDDFSKPIGIDRIGNALVIQTIPTIAVSTLATTDTGSAITFSSETTTSVTVSSNSRYGATEIPIHLLAKFSKGMQGQLKKTYRDQLLGSLKEACDQLGASTVAPLASTILGAPTNLSKAELLNAKQTLRTTAKQHYKNGGVIHFKYHVSQIKYVENISELMNADARGDAENPWVKGFFVKGLGMTFTDSANIYTAAGVAHNLMFLGSAYVKAYNIEPMLLEDQPFELVTRLISYAEVGFGEIFDTDHLVYKSPT